MDDLCEGSFEAMLVKVVNGQCCVPGCDDQSQLVFHSRHFKPYICDYHQSNGEDTHTGEYKPKNPNSTYDQWTCCENGWKCTSCRILGDFFRYRPEIPVSAQQIAHADEKEKAARIQAEQNERWERQMHAGHDEYYDR